MIRSAVNSCYDRPLLVVGGQEPLEPGIMARSTGSTVYDQGCHRPTSMVARLEGFGPQVVDGGPHKKKYSRAAGRKDSGSSSSSSSSSGSSCSSGIPSNQYIEDFLNNKKPQKKRKKKKKKSKSGRNDFDGERRMMTEQVRRLAEMQDNMLKMVQRTEQMVNGNVHLTQMGITAPVNHGMGCGTAYNQGYMTTGGPMNVVPPNYGYGQVWVKQEGNISHGPPVGLTGGSANKKERMKHLRQLKKQAKDEAEERRREQDVKQSSMTEDLEKHVKSMQRYGGAGTKKNTTGEGGQMRARAKTETLKVKRHSVDEETGEVKGQFQMGRNDPLWVVGAEIWNPANLELYAPVWREYCEKKGLPKNWGSPNESEEGGGKDNALDGGGEEEEAEAVCLRHVIDNRAHVHMELKWKGENKPSCGRVDQVMGKVGERLVLGPTWLAYCHAKGYKDELFRMKGLARVDSVIGHGWDDNGRPVAQVQWVHGEVGNIVVATALEKKTDTNRMRQGWMAYCDKIDEKEEGFRLGHVNKEQRKKPSKQGAKRRRQY
jgi:hypothetical protein